MYSETRLHVSTHSQGRGRNWSDQIGASRRTLAMGRKVGSPIHKAPLQAPCGESGYMSTRRGEGWPGSRSCSGRVQKTVGRTSPTSSPSPKKERAQAQA